MATRSSSCSSLSMNNVCVSYSNQRLDLPPPLRLNTTLLHHVAVKIGEESINQGIQKLKLRSDFGPPNPNQLSDESSPMRLGSFRLRHPPLRLTVKRRRFANPPLPSAKRRRRWWRSRGRRFSGAEGFGEASAVEVTKGFFFSGWFWTSKPKPNIRFVEETDP